MMVIFHNQWKDKVQVLHF